MKIELIDFGGMTPKRNHYNDAGADVYANEDFTLRGNETQKIPLGFGVKIPDGFAGFIFPRSGLSSQGVTCELPPIDSGYRGEVHAIMTNCGGQEFEFKKGDRIGQLVIVPCILPELVPEGSLGDERGTAAYGASGLR